MKSTISCNKTGIRWILFNYLEEFDYANDLALLSQLETRIHDKTTNLPYKIACMID